MTRVKRTKMCAECPWQRTSSPGWLGASTPLEFLRANDRREGDMPCHMAVDYKDPHWQDTLPEAPTCVGGHQFNANTHKLPVRPDMKAAQDRYGPNPDVFGTYREFLDHHDNEQNAAYVAACKEIGA